MLPIIASPVEDELLSSYIHRLVKLNLLDVASFNDMFGFTETILKRDSSDYLLDFLGEISPGAELEFFYAHTIFPGIFPFMDRFSQTKMVAQCFHKMPFPYKKSPFRTRSRIVSIRICPMCYEEEKGNRFLFGMHTAYRSHNMPGVRVCHKHGCALMVSAVNDRFPCDCNPASFSTLPVLCEDLNTEISYAVFCHDLLLMNMNAYNSEVFEILSSETEAEFPSYPGLEKTMHLVHAVFQTADAFLGAMLREYGEKCSAGGILSSGTCPDCGSPIVNSPYSKRFGFPCKCKTRGLSPEAYILHVAGNVIGDACKTDVMIKNGRLCVRYTDEKNGFHVSGPPKKMLRFFEKYPALAEKHRYRNLIRSIRRGAG